MTKTLTEMSVESSRKRSAEGDELPVFTMEKACDSAFHCLWFQNLAYL
jgi:hypothetical protein